MRILRTVVLAAGLCLVSMAHAPQAAAQRTVTCESKNNKYKDCQVTTNGSARLQSTLSSTPCVYGRTWGMDYNSIWVDRGCRGRFQVGGSGAGWESGDWGQRLKCESQNNSFNTCMVRTYGYVQVVRQLSSSPCVAGRTWGYQMDQIWVGNGCRAEFQVGVSNSNWYGDQRVITCESNDGNYSRCQTRTSGMVTLYRQVSNTRCVEGRNWGYDSYGVWVNDGCRGEFVVGGGPGSGWGEYPGTWPGPGNGGGGNTVSRGRSACVDEAQRQGYNNINTNNANQSGNIVYVNMRAVRSSRAYNVDCQYSIPQKRARLTSGGQPGDGGGNSLVDRGRDACVNKASITGYSDVNATSARQNGSDIDVEMNAQLNSRQYYLKCTYRTSNSAALLTSQEQVGGGGGGGGGNQMAQAKNACESKARASGYQVNGSGPGQSQSWGVKWQMVLQSGSTKYSAAYCNYMGISQTANLMLGTADKAR